MKANYHPECDQTKFLDVEGIVHYQNIIGIFQWLIVAGRFNINYAINLLSQYTAAPREEHLMMAKKVFGYLKKYPKKGYIINPAPPIIDAVYQRLEVKQDFGGQYGYYRE